MATYQGTLATIRAQVITALRLDATADASRVNEWVNLAYQDVVQQTGCLQQTGTATLTSGSATYSLPATVAWIRDLVITYADGSISDPLKEVTLEEILTQRRISVAGGQNVLIPIYAIVGQNQMELWPTPGAGQTMTFWYVYLPTALSADGDSPVIMEPYGSRCLLYGALVEGARFLKDPLLQDFEAQYQQWILRFQTWLNRREGASGAMFRVRGPRRTLRFANASTDTGA